MLLLLVIQFHWWVSYTLMFPLLPSCSWYADSKSTNTVIPINGNYLSLMLSCVYMYWVFTHHDPCMTITIYTHNDSF